MSSTTTLHGPLSTYTRIEFRQDVKKARLAYSGKRCEGILPNGERCGLEFSASNPPEFDHDKEAWEGGDASFENCRVRGKKCCHRPKTDAATARRAKADRQSIEDKWLKPKSKLRSRNSFKPCSAEKGPDHDT